MSKRRRMEYRTVSSFIETKYFDVVNGGTVIGDGGGTAEFIMQPIVGLTQGTNENNRIGNKVGISSIHLYGTITKQNSSVLSLGNLFANDILRFMLILDTQTNGVIINKDDVLDLGTGTYMNAFRKLNRSSRFKILKDEYLTTAQAGISWDGTNYVSPFTAQHVEWHHKFNSPLVIELSGTSGAIGEFRTNNVYFMMFSSNSNLHFNGRTRIRFTD